MPLLYGAAVLLLVAAGVVLSLRTSDGGPVTARVPDGCADVPAAVVEELFPDADPRAAERIGDRGERYGRWQDADGTLLLELRCSRAELADVLDQRRLQERAAGPSRRLTVLGVSPEAVLVPSRDGVIISQVDEQQRIERVWFVRGDVDARTARRVVQQTGPVAP